MALDGSYSGLLASIADFVNRQDLTDSIPDFVILAEADMARRLVLGGPPRDMISRAEAAIDSEFETTPVDFMGAISLRIEDSTTVLEFMQSEQIERQKSLYPSQTGNPTSYAIVGTEFQFWPAPAEEMMLDLTYIRRFASLNDSITSNWLLTLHPDAYLYASLVHSAPYLKDDERVQTWKSMYADVIASICQSGKRGITAPHLLMSPSLSVV